MEILKKMYSFNFNRDTKNNTLLYDLIGKNDASKDMNIHIHIFQTKSTHVAKMILMTQLHSLYLRI